MRIYNPSWNETPAMLRALVMAASAALGIALILSALMAGARIPRGNPYVASLPVGSCSSTSGTLALSVSTPRNAGISPYLQFVDATATTDSSVVNSVAQNVYFVTSYGDSGSSGTGTWAYGSNPGANSMNTATGIVTAHLYRVALGAGDQSYTVTVAASDGTNTTSCQFTVGAYDQNGSNGFPGTATTCVYNSSLGSGCPSGAKTLATSSIATALGSSYYGNGKRLLFKCGDTFSGDDGDNVNVAAVKVRIGAYGGCQDTQTGRPIMSNSGTASIFMMTGTTGDNAFSDLDCEGNGTGGSYDGYTQGGCVNSQDGNVGVMYQNTIYNVLSNGEVQSFFWNQCSQCGIVQGVMTGMGDSTSNTWIGVYVNGDGYSNYPYSGNTFNNIQYQALIGSHFDGGTTYAANNAETVRVFACPSCYLAYNDYLNAGPAFGVLKYHEANGGSGNPWVGQYSQYTEIGDSYFAGISGSDCSGVGPQNSDFDERVRYIVIERNVWHADGTAAGTYCGHNANMLVIAGTYVTARDNVFVVPVDSYAALAVYQDGIEPAPTNVEIFNNTVQGVAGVQNTYGFAMSSHIGGASGKTDPSNSQMENNMCYFPSSDSSINSCIVSEGTSLTVGNNTSTWTNNPAFTDGSGTYEKITDWKPTAYYSGGTSVPNIYDALGVAWSPTWDLGAVHH